jgi:hypothetical protein
MVAAKIILRITAFSPLRFGGLADADQRSKHAKADFGSLQLLLALEGRKPPIEILIGR